MIEPYYHDPLAGITIYHGRCEDILPLLDRVDHAILDPPYEQEAHTLGRRAYSSAGSVAPRPLSFDRMREPLRRTVAKELARITDRWILTFCQVEATEIWRNAYARHGLIYKRTGIWVKPGAAPQFTGDRPGMGYESIVMMHPKGRSRWHGGGKHGIFTHPCPSKSVYHETEKPIRLMRELIQLFTDPGDTILDCFGGAGSTAIAAKELGRKCIVIEQNLKHCRTAALRLSQEILALEYV